MRALTLATMIAAAMSALPGAARAATVVYRFAGAVDAVSETERWDPVTGTVRTSDPAAPPFQIRASFTLRTAKLPPNSALAPGYAQYLSGPLPPTEAWLTSAIEGESSNGATWPLVMNGEGDVVLDGREPDGPASLGNSLFTFGPDTFELGTTMYNGTLVKTQYRQYFRSGLLDGAGSFFAGAVRLPNFSTGLNAPFATFESVNVVSLDYFDMEDRLVFSERRVSGLRKAVPITVTVAPDAVPEPAQWTTLLIGFGLIGAAKRFSFGRPAHRPLYPAATNVHLDNLGSYRRRWCG